MPKWARSCWRGEKRDEAGGPGRPGSRWPGAAPMLPLQGALTEGTSMPKWPDRRPSLKAKVAPWRRRRSPLASGLASLSSQGRFG